MIQVALGHVHRNNLIECFVLMGIFFDHFIPGLDNTAIVHLGWLYLDTHDREVNST